MRLSRRGLHHVMSPLFSLKLSEVELEPPPATYQIAMLPLQHRTVGKAGVEPAVSCSQGTRGTVASSSRFHFSVAVTRVGFEPNLFSLKG